MVTELEDAHAHLREAQECLRLCRLGEPGVFGFERPYSENLRQLERQVKSAISWVWDAQERERENTARAETARFFAGFAPTKTVIVYRSWLKPAVIGGGA